MSGNASPPAGPHPPGGDHFAGGRDAGDDIDPDDDRRAGNPGGHGDRDLPGRDGNSSGQNRHRHANRNSAREHRDAARNHGEASRHHRRHDDCEPRRCSRGGRGGGVRESGGTAEYHAVGLDRIRDSRDRGPRRGSRLVVEEARGAQATRSDAAPEQE